MPLNETVIRGAEFDTNTPAPAFSMSVEGLEGTGKTHFSLLGTPPPVVHINLADRDATWFMYNMSEERRKQTTLYDIQPSTPNGWTRDEAREAINRVSAIAKDHLSDRKMIGGTFVLDSGTSYWEQIQAVYVAPEQEKREQAKLEGLPSGKRTGGLEYMQGNLIVNGVINWIKNQGAFVILTHRKTQEWGPTGPIPGKFRAQINRKVPYLVEVRLDLYKICTVCGAEECEAKKHQGRKHMARFLKFSASTALEGFAWELTEEDPGFAMVYQLYTGKGPFWK